jgi:hypothetical protein
MSGPCQCGLTLTMDLTPVEAVKVLYMGLEQRCRGDNNCAENNETLVRRMNISNNSRIIT